MATSVLSVKPTQNAVVKNVRKYRTIVRNLQKNKPNELLKTGIVGGTSIVFCQYHESGKYVNLQ